MTTPACANIPDDFILDSSGSMSLNPYNHWAKNGRVSATAFDGRPAASGTWTLIGEVSAQFQNTTPFPHSLRVYAQGPTVRMRMVPGNSWALGLVFDQNTTGAFPAPSSFERNGRIMASHPLNLSGLNDTGFPHENLINRWARLDPAETLFMRWQVYYITFAFVDHESNILRVPEIVLAYDAWRLAI